MVDDEDPESLKPLIDGGTEGESGLEVGGGSERARGDWIGFEMVEVEVDVDGMLVVGCCTGFKGQARVILPTISACYECSVRDLSS